MKKSIGYILALVIVFFATETSFSQTVLEKETISDLNKTPNYAIGVSDEDGLLSALSLFDTFTNNGVQFQNFEIVVKGPIVKNMVKGSDLEKQFEKYKGKIRVSICSVAMKRQGITKDELFSELEVVETYTIRILQLQALGYNSILY